jgi:hypothetical protein
MISISGCFLHKLTASNPFLRLIGFLHIFNILEINFSEILSSSATSIFNFVFHLELLILELGLLFNFIGLYERDFKIKNSPIIYIVFSPNFA